MDNRLYDIIQKLPRQNITNLMLSALDEMQAYNGRSIQECVLIAAGSKGHTDEKTGKVSWKLPKLSELKKITGQQPLTE